MWWVGCDTQVSCRKTLPVRNVGHLCITWFRYKSVTPKYCTSPIPYSGIEPAPCDHESWLTYGSDYNRHIMVIPWPLQLIEGQSSIPPRVVSMSSPPVTVDFLYQCYRHLNYSWCRGGTGPPCSVYNPDHCVRDSDSDFALWRLKMYYYCCCFVHLDLAL